MAGVRALWRATGMKENDFGKPIMATVNRYYGIKVNSSSYSDDNKTINPLAILTAPLWFPVAMIDCLNEVDSLIYVRFVKLYI
ncbi:dihydroxy-acid dehydratase [Haemophilus sputorum]|uniref:dihydroxy-acid dehydratase n=1 Tax=Haemophilus sputorum TaxID=1078480 RepID=UPI001CECD63D|nr:dihydroxy-acid dehydratase [Haemophilus sputorum]